MFAGEMLPALIPVAVLVAMFALAAFWISRRSRMRELAHRERLAMIEKGLLPPAELFPGGAPVVTLGAAEPSVTTSKAALRFRTAGVMFVGIGVALALIVGVAAGSPSVGLGLGGAIVALGAAMIVNGVLGAREPQATRSAPEQPGAPLDIAARE